MELVFSKMYFFTTNDIADMANSNTIDWKLYRWSYSNEAVRIAINWRILIIKLRQVRPINSIWQYNLHIMYTFNCSNRWRWSSWFQKPTLCTWLTIFFAKTHLIKMTFHDAIIDFQNYPSQQTSYCNIASDFRNQCMNILGITRLNNTDIFFES